MKDPQTNPEGEGLRVGEGAGKMKTTVHEPQ